MRAARWHAAGDVRVEDVAEPAISRPGDVLIEVDLATLCASDLAEWRDGPHVIPAGRPHRLTGVVAPVTLGHEYVGRVLQAGDAVSGLRAGDRVCGDACLRCGVCYWCVRGEYNICAVGGSVGLHLDGAFASRLVVPDYTLAAVPASVDDRSAAVVEPLAVSLHALRQVRMQAGDSVVVVGMGMIGAGAVLLARVLGARTVVVVEPSASRQALAGRLGASAVLDPRSGSIRREVREVTGIGADVVLDCTGRPDTLGDAVEFSRRGGRIGICGIAHEPSALRTDRLVYFERQVTGCLGYRYDHAAVLGLLEDGRIDTSLLFADPIDLADIVESGLRRMAEDPGVQLRIPVLPK